MGILILIRFQHSLSEIYIHFRNHFFQSCAVRQTAFCRVSAQHCTENYVVIFIFIFPYFEHSRRHPTAKYTQNSFLFLSFAARARLFSAPSVSLNGTSLCQRRPNATSLYLMHCRRCAAWIVSHLPASAFAQSVIYYDQWRQYLPPTSAKRSHCTSLGLELYTCRPHGVVAGQWSVVRLIFDTDPSVTSQRTDQALHRLATGR